jgi:hypothetical protein
VILNNKNTAPTKGTVLSINLYTLPYAGIIQIRYKGLKHKFYLSQKLPCVNIKFYILFTVYNKNPPFCLPEPEGLIS